MTTNDEDLAVIAFMQICIVRLYVFEYESMYANANASEFIIRDAMTEVTFGGGGGEFCGAKRLAKRDEDRRYSPLEQL
jgi:hypothetical protein